MIAERYVPESCLVACDVRAAVLAQARTREEFAKQTDEEIVEYLKRRFDAHVAKTGDPSCHPSSVGYLGECLHFGYAGAWLGVEVQICEEMLANPYRHLHSTSQYPKPTGPRYRVTSRTTMRNTALYGDTPLVGITPVE